MFTLARKVRVQLEDLIIHKNDSKSLARIALTVANRRGISFPSAIYNYFNKPPEISDELGDETFLLDFMIPQPGKCLVDIGASIGAWTFNVAKRGFEVYAYEPSPKAYEVLRERAKKYCNVHAFGYALGDKDGIGRLGYTAFGLSGTMDEEIHIPGGKTIDIALRKLDSLSITQVGVIKIDTEGYEVPILKGAKDTIQKWHPTLIIEVHQDIGEASKTFSEELNRIKNTLKEFGYNWWVHYRPNGLHDKQPHVVANPER
jgi:FkbM family methyltransferase